MDEDNATLSAEFGIEFGGVFGELKTLDDLVGKSTANLMREWKKVEQAVAGGLNVREAGLQFMTVANAADQAGDTATKALARVEQETIRLTSRLERQATVFGKTTAEVRQYDAAMKAAAARDLGAGAAADKLEAAAARLAMLEAAGSGAARGMKSTGSAMAAIAPQAQDVFTQVSMGANVLNVLAIQGGQVASQMTYMGGAAGKFGAFMMGPWGLALTGGALLVGTLSSKLLDSSEAAKKAEEAMKVFQTRQSDIGNFIDSTTGRLTEQNRVLVLNAVLTRQAQLAANDKAMSEARAETFRLARNQLDANAPMTTSMTSGAGIMMRMTDPRVTAAIQKANGDVGRLVDSIGALARSDPKLGKLALQLSATAGGAVLASRENAKLREELAALNRGTSGAARASSSLIEKQVALATATTPLARARAELALVQERGAAADKAGGKALDVYRTDLTRATQAVNAAEAAQQGARAAVRDHNKELRDHRVELRKAEQAARELQSTYENLQGRFDPAGAAQRGYREALAEIEKVRKAGLITDDQAGDYQFGAIREAAERAKTAVAEFKGELDRIPTISTTVDLEVKGLDRLLGTNFNVFETISRDADRAANAMSRAFGRAGDSIGDAVSNLGDYGAQQDRIERAGLTREQAMRESSRLRLASTTALAGAAKSMFAENSRGYAAMAAAEKALTLVQLARTAVDVAGGAARMFASLGPAGFPAVAAMLGVMASVGFTGGSSSAKPPASNTGTGTVFGDSAAQSQSIVRAIDDLKGIDPLLGTSREMAMTLRSIEGRIGGLASLVVRAGNVNADSLVTTGFQTNAIGSVLKAVVPIFGGALASLFGSKTEVTGNGLFAGPQSVGSVLSSGFDASYYSDVKKTSKFLGITTGTKYITKYTGADAGLENQFTLILSDFSKAITAAAGPLGAATGDIQSRVNGFVVNLGRIDLKGLTGTEIQEKLTAVFGAAADGMASAAFPGFERFAEVGEGMFETLVRVSSTVEQVSGSLDLLGTAARTMGIDAKVGLAAQFDSVGDLNSAITSYFEAFYTPAEQNAARLAQLGKAFVSLGMTIPDTLAGFRGLVEAQNLTTAAGQATYATLLQLAPSFAELKKEMDGARSAADVLSERQGLERRLLELKGETAAIRELDLAKLDASNRALQQEIWATEAAQEAAKAAQELQDAWAGVGATIMDEVRRIRGLTNEGTSGNFMTLQGEFNAALERSRAGDIDVAKTLPALSQAMLAAAANVATSRQELDRVRSQTAAQLESLATASSHEKAFWAAATAASLAPTGGAGAAASAATAEASSLRDEVAAMRSELRSLLTDVKANTGTTAKVLDRAQGAAGGDVIGTRAVA